MNNGEIKAFRRAAYYVPAYKQILLEKGIDPKTIKTPDDFRKNVPILGKEDLFEKYSPADLCMPKTTESLATAIVTSGTSGFFGYGTITKHEIKIQKRTIDWAFRIIFQTHKIKPLIINALPMGVSFSSSHPVVPTSVRSDIAWNVIKNFGFLYGQIIILADPNFAKKLVEEGRENNFFGFANKLKLVVGGDWSSKSYFEYIKGAGIRNIMSTFGTTEIGLNIGFADERLHRIRSEIQNNTSLQRSLFGIELKTAPALFSFFNQKTYIEKINPDMPFSELAFTTLSKTSMPFIRYSTGDVGTILDTKLLNKTLAENHKEDLFIKWPFPILALSGRKSNQVSIREEILTAEDVKQALYSVEDIAKNITGNFRLSADGSTFNIDVQTAKNIIFPDLHELIEKTVTEFLGKNISVNTYEYKDFPYNMVLDYESKWAYTKAIKNSKVK